MFRASQGSFPLFKFVSGLVCFFLVVCPSLSLRAFGQTNASLLTPRDGQHVLAAGGAVFEWTPITQAQAYYLYVGTYPGASDLVNTGEMSATACRPTTTFPLNTPLYARIWTKVDQRWQHSPDVVFRAVAGVASISSPKDGALNVDLGSPMVWSEIPNAISYRVSIGSEVGSSNLWDTGEVVSATSPMPQLPLNQKLYARLYTNFGLEWGYVDFTFVATSDRREYTPKLIYPLNGERAFDENNPVRWAAVDNAEAYYLYMGTSPGGKDVVDSGEFAGTIRSVHSLPKNRPLFATLFAKVAGRWYSSAAEFQAVESAENTTASIKFPANGASDILPGSQISWDPIEGAEAYYLSVGTAQDSSDVVNTGETLATSYTLGAVPFGKPLYTKISTKWNGKWRSSQMAFSAVQPLIATLSTPIHNSISSSEITSFEWSLVPSASAYYLYVGTSPGASDIVDSGELSRTTFAAANLPTNKPLYAKVWTKMFGVWVGQQVRIFNTFNSKTALLVQPENLEDVDVSQPVTWTPIPGAEAYRLQIGTSLDASDTFDSGETTLTALSIQEVPINKRLYAKLGTRVSGNWTYSKVEITATKGSVLSTIVFPSDGALDVDTSKAFSWTNVESCEAYYLTIGTGPGGRDVYDSGELTSTAIFPSFIPINQQLHATIYSKVGERWRSTRSTFTPRLQTFFGFTYPAVGDIGFDSSRAFEWAGFPVGGSVTYELSIGTSPESSDIFRSGPLSTRSLTIPAGVLPVGATLYARVAGVGPRDELVAYTSFMVAGSSAPDGIMIYPQSGQTDVTFDRMFKWEINGLAESYRLQLLQGATSIADTGELEVPFYRFAQLPAGAYTGILSQKISGHWIAKSFVFEANGGASNPNENLLAATNSVRCMADSVNTPFPWTPLARTVRAGRRHMAVCTDYATQLLLCTSDGNLSQGFTGPRLLSIGFLPNAYDVHTLVEYQDATSQRWGILDPTFDLTVRRADGSTATKEDVQISALTKTWGSVKYVSLGEPRPYTYYIDYPLLYLHLLSNASGSQPAVNYADFLQEVGLQAPPGFVLFKSNLSTLTITLNGVVQSIAFGTNGFSWIIYTTSVSVVDPLALRAFRVKRFVF